jgi:hypothetical protein
MIGIQFGVYEAMRQAMVQRKVDLTKQRLTDIELADDADEYSKTQAQLEAAMEVAASPEHPYPAPKFLQRDHQKKVPPLKD